MADTEYSFLVDFIADVDSTLSNKNDLIELLQLVNNCCSSLLKSRLETCQDIHHKLSVGSVLPGEEGWNDSFVYLSVHFDVVTSICHDVEG